MEAKKLNIPEAPKATFMQQPYWGAKDQIKLNGDDFEMLYNFVNSFGPAVDAARRVMQENINIGIIKIRNVDEAGQEVSEEVVKKYFEDLQNWQRQIKNLNAQAVSDNPEGLTVERASTADTDAVLGQEQPITDAPVESTSPADAEAVPDLSQRSEGVPTE